jgi:hypothetical protein
MEPEKPRGTGRCGFVAVHQAGKNNPRRATMQGIRQALDASGVVFVEEMVRLPAPAIDCKAPQFDGVHI